jgi:hypothetical protein
VGTGSREENAKLLEIGVVLLHSTPNSGIAMEQKQASAVYVTIVRKASF